MLRRNFSGLMVCIMCLGAASLSLAGQPDHSMSFYATASGTAEVSVFCAPDGGGKALTEAKLEAGGEVDATITLTVNDATGARSSCILRGYVVGDQRRGNGSL